MSYAKPLPILAVTVALLCGSSAAAIAATAHNSQAGANGPTSRSCEPTPYFPEGGCLSTFLQDQFDGDGGALPPPARLRGRRPAPPVDEGF